MTKGLVLVAAACVGMIGLMWGAVFADRLVYDAGRQRATHLQPTDVSPIVHYFSGPSFSADAR